MDINNFTHSLTGDGPPEHLSPLLKALWWDAKGSWDNARRAASDVDSPDAAWVHAYLHRKKKDNFNAEYWYARSGQIPYYDSVEQEFLKILKTLLDKYK